MREEEEESEAQTVLVQETPGELKANSSISRQVSWYHTNSSRAAGARPPVSKSQILTYVNVKRQTHKTAWLRK